MIQKSWLAAKVTLSVSYTVRSSKTIVTYQRAIADAASRATPRIVDSHLKRRPWHAQHEALLDVSEFAALQAEEDSSV